SVVDELTEFALLLHRGDDAAALVIPVDHAVHNGGQEHARLAQRVNPVARLDTVKPSKPGLVPRKNGLEVPTLLGVTDHLLEFKAALRVVAADGIIGVPAQKSVALLVGVALDRLLLLRQGGFLAVAVTGTSQITDGGNPGRHGVTLL